MYKDSIRSNASADDNETTLQPASQPTPSCRAVAWQGSERRAGQRASQWLMSRVLDEIDYGLLLVDPQRQVLHANRAALALLRATRSLVLTGNTLGAADPRDTSALGAAIHAAAAHGLRRMIRIEGRDTVVVAVVPLPEAPAGEETSVLLLLSRQLLCEALSAHGFARLHGLSGAESRVLEALCQGRQAAEIAAMQRVAISTVRTQIASIRLKTDATSICDLVHRVARLPPILGALRIEGRAPALDARA